MVKLSMVKKDGSRTFEKDFSTLQDAKDYSFYAKELICRICHTDNFEFNTRIVDIITGKVLYEA